MLGTYKAVSEKPTVVANTPKAEELEYYNRPLYELVRTTSQTSLRPPWAISDSTFRRTIRGGPAQTAGYWCVR